jgi:hypothetical protein
MTRGRPVDGGKRIGRCDGSEDAKARAETVLAYLARELTAEEACARLGIGASRFHEIVNQSLQGLVEANEPGTAGRPRESTEEDERLTASRARVTQLEQELRIAKLLERGWMPYQRPSQKKTDE